MLLKLLQLLDDVAPHLLRDNRAHRLTDLGELDLQLKDVGASLTPVEDGLELLGGAQGAGRPKTVSTMLFCRHQQHSRASLGDDAWRWSYLIELPAPVMGETFYWQVGGRTRTMDDAAKELAAHILKKLQAASEIIEPETEDNDTDVAETPGYRSREGPHPAR